MEKVEIANAVGTSSSVPRNTRIMEGVGARVIRGPDWKWGKQVCEGYVLFEKVSFLGLYVLITSLLNQLE